MAPIRAVLFDYGHTLIDFTPSQDRIRREYELIRAELEAQGRAALPAEIDLVASISARVEEAVAASYARNSLDEVDVVELFADAYRSLGIDLEPDDVRRLAEREHRAYVSEMRVREETLEVLRELGNRNYRLGLVSNAHFLPNLMRQDIERFDIAPYIDAAVFSSEIGVRKPHRRIFEHVLVRLGVPSSEAVFVGDRLRDDIGGAHAIGMRAVLTHEFRHEQPSVTLVPDQVIGRLSDLLTYLDESR
ncbi:MAG TPA: HAD family hydrolase [Chloroflexota bacterium]|nr:HAD family hydrolase [Chloroflexota bacterium]